MIKYAYIGFGSNLGDRAENFRRTSELLQREAQVIRVAPVVESLPVDGVDGGKFLNTVYECERTKDVHSFMKMLQSIEASIGGKTEKLGDARTCDLDVLLWGDEVIELPDLKVPHPRMHLRDFYLIPICELIPNERHPRLGQSFAELLAGIELRSVCGVATA